MDLQISDTPNVRSVQKQGSNGTTNVILTKLEMLTIAVITVLVLMTSIVWYFHKAIVVPAAELTILVEDIMYGM